MTTACMVHATTVALSGQGILILGASGAGKSLLALRIIERGAFLIADDQTTISIAGARLRASSPPSIKGRMEVRGVGIVQMPWQRSAGLKLAVELGQAEERLPGPRFWSPRPGDPKWPSIPCVRIDASAAYAAEAALTALELRRE